MKFNKLLICFILTILSSNIFAGPKVGGGGVGYMASSPIANLLDSSKVGGGADEGAVDLSPVISQDIIEKLKKLGVEKFVLENGETIDLNASGEGIGN